MAKKRVRVEYTCRCGQPGTYRYSYELSVWLKLHPWEGLVLCDACMNKIDEEWRQGVSDVKNE